MKLFNTLTKQKEEFVPLEKGHVKMYSCGPTVYNFFHIGNARPFIIFDTLRRYLEYGGNKVTFVQNFTDIDDKMINRANNDGITVKELAEKFIAEYFTDAGGLGIKDATVHPKATESIRDIVSLIRKLEEKGFAYVVDGDVYFDTRSFADYGKLSHQESMLTAESAIPWILPCGRRKNRVNRHGTAHGAKGGRDGILNALPWRRGIWAIPSIFTAEVRTSFSPIMRMRSHKAKRPQENLLPDTGSITASFT